MFLSNPVKSFLAIAIGLLVSPGCSFWQQDENRTASFVPETKSSIPFSTKEPEVYQAEIVITSGQTVTKMLVTRNGSRRRIDYDYGEANQRTILQTDKEYLIYYAAKSYSENSSSGGRALTETRISEVTAGLLNQRTDAKFEELETENNLAKYRVRFGESNAAEAIVYFDKTLEMPVKQEFFSLAGEERILQYIVEFKNIQLETDESLFQIPAGFRKVRQAVGLLQ